ncbi:MAG: hypothetical protein HRT49_17850 [Cognatishimia sp.]|nr:hypothetical protein [Cognatishimia sp.]
MHPQKELSEHDTGSVIERTSVFPPLREVGRTDVYDAPLSVQEEVLLLRRRLGKITRQSKAPETRARASGFMALVACVLLLVPVGVYAYLSQVAVPQYFSTAGFTTRASDTPSQADVLAGGFGFGLGSQASENDILFSYLYSQELVAHLDAQLDLRQHFSAHWAQDPMFHLSPEAALEQMHSFWLRALDVAYDRTTGLIEMRLRATDPAWAATVLTEVLAASGAKVNDINQAAQADALRFAQTALAQAEQDWQDSISRVQAFRVANGIVDPAIEIEARMGVLTSLQHQLAEALIDLDEMAQTTDSADPRFRKLQDRVTVIRQRLGAERLSFSGDTPQDGQSFPELVSTYEALSTDLEFAQLRYTSALAALSQAQTEAAQKSRYLAVYLEPSIAETSEFPKPLSAAALSALICALLFAIFSMVYLSVRERR